LQVRKSNRFKTEIKQIVRFIGQSNPKNAESFYYKLMARLDSLADSPYKGRPNDDGNRELIYKGYTVPYMIDTDAIIILGIFNQNEWKSKEDK